MIRIPRIKVNVVHDHVRRGHELEGLAGVHGLVEPFSGSRVHNLAMGRVLLKYAGSARGGGNPLNLAKLRARILALVDSAARAQKYCARPVRIEDDGKHIRVVDQALLDDLPARAPVAGLPGQMPGARINNVGVRRVHSQRFHLMNLPAERLAEGADLRPGRACIRGAKDTRKCSREKHPGVRGRLHQGANRLAAQTLDPAPAPARVVAHPQAAVGVLPSRHIDRGRIGGVHHDVVQNQAVRRAQPGKTMPGGACIQRFVEPTVGGSKVEMAGLPGD